MEDVVLLRSLGEVSRLSQSPHVSSIQDLILHSPLTDVLLFHHPMSQLYTWGVTVQYIAVQYSTAMVMQYLYSTVM